MRLFTLAAEADPEAAPLLAAIRQALPQARVEVFNSAEGLADRFRMPLTRPATAVLLVRGHDELEQLNAMSDLLLDVRVVMILPPELFARPDLAHQLAPRFLAMRGCGHGRLQAVLRRMHESDNLRKVS